MTGQNSAVVVGLPINNSLFSICPFFRDGIKDPLPGSWAFQVVLLVKNLSADVGDKTDVSLIPGLGRSPVEGNGNPLQYSCLENPMDRGVCGLLSMGL